MLDQLELFLTTNDDTEVQLFVTTNDDNFEAQKILQHYKIFHKKADFSIY